MPSKPGFIPLISLEGTPYDSPNSDVINFQSPKNTNNFQILKAYIALSVLVTPINFLCQYIIRAIAIRLASSISNNPMTIAWVSWFFASIVSLFLSFFIFRWVVKKFILSN